jgi:hypothetical protein
LFKVVTTHLPFLPSAASAETEARKSLKKTLGGLQTAVLGICELRNSYGFASHGAAAGRPAMDAVQAFMVAQSADAIIGFLHRVHRQGPTATRTSRRLEYEDNPEFNGYVDDAHESVRIFDEEFAPSRVLFVYLTEYQVQLDSETVQTTTANPAGGQP